MRSNKIEPFLWIILGGLIVWGYGAATNKTAEKVVAASTSSAQRKLATTTTVSAGPKTTSWDTPQGTVIAVDIPKSMLDGQFVEIKHCIVWRDAATKTSSLHCDKDEIDTSDYPSDPPDLTQ